MGALAEKSLRIRIVGGGPGGLFAALLLKERMPQHEVVLYERKAFDAIFGFGVVFSAQTLGGLDEADPRLVQSMAAAGVSWEDIEIRRAGRSLRCGGHGFSAISRRALLLLLQERAREVGVDLHFEREAADEDLAGADLVIAADGVNSAIRSQFESAFQPRVLRSVARYIWFATPQPFDALTFAFLENEHGHWGVHAYPFEDGTSTFIVETDEETWRKAGLDAHRDLQPGQSDMHSLRYCEEVFSEHLHGNPVLENNSRWMQFGTLRCDSWCHENVALLGDSAHTAHFSVGSGTKMAMEDAVGLVNAISEADEIPSALAGYELRRRPAVDRIQRAAAPSLVWWERFRFLANRSDEEFAFHFLTRSPSVTRRRLLARDWRFVDRVERRLAEESGGEISLGPLAAPLETGGLRLPGRLVVAATADALGSEKAIGGALYGAGLVLLAGSPEDGEEVAAWIREHTGAAVGLLAHADDTDAAAASAAGFQMFGAPLGAAGLRSWPVDRPLLSFVGVPDDPAGEAGDEALAELAALAEGRVILAAVMPGGDPASALERQLAFCDRVRDELGVQIVLVDGAPDADAAATAVLSGRADLILAAPSLASERWQESGIRTLLERSATRVAG